VSDLLRGFEDLKGMEDEFYPHSTQRRRESRDMRRARMKQERKAIRAEEGWDAHPKVWTNPATGESLELFYIGALAKALGRRSVTIRSWIDKGWIPKAGYVTRGRAGTRGDAGLRLWNRKQIEGMQKIAEEEGLLDEIPPLMTNTRFTERVIASWREWT
jgi:hypothetical protein